MREQILALYNELSDHDRESLLKELNMKSLSAKTTVNNISVKNCPYCDSNLYKRNGKRGALQKYKCKSCGKEFSAITGTPAYRIQKQDKFETYKSLLFDGYLPIKDIASKVGISIQTAFDWRHKILSAAGNDGNKFEGITEIDDIWFLYSQKGRKGLQYARKRGGSKRAGDNDYQAKLLITADRNLHTDLSLIRIGRMKKIDIQRTVGNKFTDKNILVSDKHRSIASFARTAGLKHVSFKASDHTIDKVYHVQKVNNMASRLKGIINHSLRGVSTKYLQNYANWYKLQSDNTNQESSLKNLMNNKDAWNLHANREGIYKHFILNFSKRTYRCPVKRTFKAEVNSDMLPKLHKISSSHNLE